MDSLTAFTLCYPPKKIYIYTMYKPWDT